MRFTKTIVVCLLLIASTGAAQNVTWDDYQRASNLRTRFQGVVLFDTGAPAWIGTSQQFWYRRSVDGGHEFVIVDANSPAKRPAFDHERLAAAISTAANEKYTSLKLPFSTFFFADNQKAITFNAKASAWRCDLTEYTCRRTGDVVIPGRGGNAPRAVTEMDNDASDYPFAYPFDYPYEGENDVFDGIAYPQDAPQQGQRGGGPAAPSAASLLRASPDGKWEALIRNHNVFIRPKGKITESTPLSFDGSEGNYYTLQSVTWSSDSTHLVAYRVRPGYQREVHFIQSSPDDQVQPKHLTTSTVGGFGRTYAKPGDTLDIAQPVLFDAIAKKQIIVDNALFPNPFSLSRAEWRKSGRAFTFEYNQRGHQVFRVIEVDASTGQARALISEEPKTFFTYSRLAAAASGSGGFYRYDAKDGAEIIWRSERDGWGHLYLYDGVTGKVKSQITKGNWVVRYVDKVDEEKRQIWFRAGGIHPGQDPYFTHSYRVNFDGTGLTELTNGDGNHVVAYSNDMKYLVDVWSRVDKAPVTELRSAETGKLLLDLEQSDIKKLESTGWRAPEVFTAKGRDGQTDIWGVIFRPSTFDPAKKYPVIEAIYAGPQGSFVPKSFGGAGRGGQGGQATEYAPNLQMLTELGFIVVQIDGMGTANRSKAFHDVAWKNLGDAGFPDRILWHQAVAAKYPSYDITRVGIFGTSAGGQNALGGLLFHPEFYKVGIANSGCHDNRMDKIWWNEQWMSWPIGPEYAASSNVDNAHRLRGKLQLVVPELDTNVDPASTMQVVNALMKANKKFDLLVVPGGDHGAGGRFGQRLMFDFFVHNLHGVEPPEWKSGGLADDAALATERVPN